MTAKFQLLVHPELRDQLRDLHARAQQNPSGREAQEFEAVRQGLSALRDGREADFSGERLGYSDRHADLRDCAEIKLPVVEEFNRRGRPMGPSHRLTYREFEGPTAGDLPIRQPIAFEPRKDGRPFEVTAGRLGRTSTTAGVRDGGFGGDELLRCSLTWSGELGHAVGTLNTLFRVHGPCLGSTASRCDRCAAYRRRRDFGGVRQVWRAARTAATHQPRSMTSSHARVGKRSTGNGRLVSAGGPPSVSQHHELRLQY